MNDKFLEKLEKNPFVYHYTNIEALFAILEGSRSYSSSNCCKCFGKNNNWSISRLSYH